MVSKDKLKHSFTHSGEKTVQILKKNLCIIYISMGILAVMYALVTFFPVRNGVVVSYLILLQEVLFVYQSLPLITDLRNPQLPPLKFDGRVVNRKGIFMTKLTVKNMDGTKIKLLTDKKNIELGENIKGLCTKKAKLIISCTFKK